jgi:four helix bundle protein
LRTGAPSAEPLSLARTAAAEMSIRAIANAAQCARHCPCALARIGRESPPSPRREGAFFSTTTHRGEREMFIAYDVTKELITSLRELVSRIREHDRDLADQLHRAATSVLLNLAEGQKFNNGNRRKHYEIAQGSANEVKAAIDAAEAWGWIESATVQRQLIDRVLALLWKLSHADAIQSRTSRRGQAGRGQVG